MVDTAPAPAENEVVHHPELEGTDMPAPAVEISKRPNPIQRAINIWRYRELLVNLVRKELKVKYKDSVLGFLWTLLNPMMYLVVFSLVFNQVLRVQVPYFAIFFLSGLLAWTFFSTAVSAGTGSIVANAPLVQKVWFPREVLALSALGAALVHFFFQLIVLAAAMLIFRRTPDWSYFPVLALALVIMLVLATALGVAFSATNVYLRDTGHLMELVMLAWFWMSAIVYPYRLMIERVTGLFGPGWEWLASLNPLIPVLTTFQKTLYNPSAPFAWYTNSKTENGVQIPRDPAIFYADGPKGPDTVPIVDTAVLPSTMKEQALPVVPMDHTMGWYLTHLAWVGGASILLLFGALWVFGRLEDDLAEEI